MNWAKILPYFAASVSVVSAGVSIYQARLASKVPFRSALYSVRSNAIRDFVLASGNFDAALRRARIEVPFDVEQPGSIEASFDDQLLENAKASFPVIVAHGTYLASVNATLPPWSNETRSKIGVSLKAAVLAADCYVQLGAQPRERPPAYWAEVRQKAAPACQNAVKGLTLFTNAIAAAEAAMIHELLLTQSDDLPPGEGNEAGGL